MKISRLKKISSSLLGRKQQKPISNQSQQKETIQPPPTPPPENKLEKEQPIGKSPNTDNNVVVGFIEDIWNSIFEDPTDPSDNSADGLRVNKSLLRLFNWSMAALILVWISMLILVWMNPSVSSASPFLEPTNSPILDAFSSLTIQQHLSVLLLSTVLFAALFNYLIA